ncbi:unnamed protein product [Acanthoscelides obtectus]|uniref:PiggyBac transposable element-derived protein domain-containing protein n=1 Tax=Acanthoscelides obtectus TaxID=200917 RepID=A0A9P0KUN0_ACAOB|nr:unnamed protein product [Acanthoscelides obtectus]CAK1635580.1 PiggyBac transposable element-derived protein 3 [Acanthoscelides obtectus]
MNEDDAAEIPNKEEAIFFDDDGFDTSDDEFLASKKLRLVPPPVPVTSTTFAVPPLQPKWEKGPLEYIHSSISNEDFDMEHLKNVLAGKTPLEMFFLFFDDNLINLILDFSVKYAQQNNRHGFCLSKGELLNFLGIMLFSGYHTLPQVPLYWSNEEDKGIDIVKKCMSRNRFQAIKRNIHLSDNRAIANKERTSLGLGGEIVNNLLANVDYPARHNIFFDNFFSSYQLLVDLKNKGFYATGTIRSNRTGHCPLVEPKIMSKRERGAYDCAYDKKKTKFQWFVGMIML